MTLREQLIRDEGRRARPYHDTLGHLTIGVGRNLDAKGLSSDEIDFLFDHDINDAETALTHACPWSGALDAPRQAVLIGMAFNLGMTGLLEFHRMLRACAAGDYASAAGEMRASVWHGQVGARAERLACQMETGEWV